MSTVEFVPGVTGLARDRYHRHFGSHLELAEWLDVVLQILDRRATVQWREDSGAERVLVEIRGEQVSVLWDPHKAALVTVFPPKHGPELAPARAPAPAVRWAFDA